MPWTSRGLGIVVPLALAAVVSACGAGAGASPQPVLPSKEVPSLEPAPVTSAPTTGEVPVAIMATARAELAKSVGAGGAAEATVVQAEAVDWPDGSLGCPQPDMMYPQVITPGYHIVFELDGKQYDFRATVQGGVVPCESGRPLGG